MHINKSGSISTEHGVTHYRIDGPRNGRPILLIHGATVGLWTFNQLVPHLTKQGFLCYRFDLYGHGLSSRPKTNYSIELFVNQGMEFIERVIGHKTFTLFGHSLGGVIAAGLMHSQSRRIEKLFLCAPMLNFSQGKWLSKILQHRRLGFIAMALIGRPLLKRRRLKRLQQLGLSNEIQLYLNQYKLKGYWQAMWRLEYDGVLSDQSETYRALQYSADRIEMIYGTADQTIPLDDQLKICALISKPKDQMILLPGLEHNLLLSHPMPLSHIIKESLEETERDIKRLARKDYSEHT